MTITKDPLTSTMNHDISTIFGSDCNLTRNQTISNRCPVNQENRLENQLPPSASHDDGSGILIKRNNLAHNSNLTDPNQFTARHPRAKIIRGSPISKQLHKISQHQGKWGVFSSSQKLTKEISSKTVRPRPGPYLTA